MAKLLWDEQLQEYRVVADENDVVNDDGTFIENATPIGGGQEQANIDEMQAGLEASTKEDPLTPGLDVGKWLQQSLQVAANVPASIATGLVDLGLMAADATIYGTENFGGALKDEGPLVSMDRNGLGVNLSGLGIRRINDWKQIGEARDNPLTAARIQHLTPESKLMQGVNFAGEFLGMFVGAGWVGKAAKGGMAVAKGEALIGGLASGAGAISKTGTAAKGLGAIGDALKMDPLIGGFTSALGRKGFEGARVAQAAGLAEKSTGMREILKRSAGNDEFTQLLVSNIMTKAPQKNWARKAGQVIGSNAEAFMKASPAMKLRWLGDTVVKDAVATFMMTGTRSFEDEAGMSQLVADWNLPYISESAKTLQVQAADAPLIEKSKLMLDGVVTGLMLQPVFDLGRIMWMSRGIAKATPDPVVIKGLLAAARETSGDFIEKELGLPRGLGSLEDLAQTLEQARITNQQNSILNQIGKEQEVMDQVNARLAGRYDEWEGRGKASPGLMGEIPDLERINAGRAPKPAWEKLPTPEPIVTPEAIRNAFMNDLAKIQDDPEAMDPEVMSQKIGELHEKVVNLLPPKRSGKVDFLLTFNALVNRAGVMHAADSIWHDAAVGQGLDEGWVQMADDWSGFTANRSLAEQLDADDDLGRFADEVDTAMAQERFLQEQQARPAAEQTVDVEAAPVEEAAPPAQALPEGPTPEQSASQMAAEQVGAAGAELARTEDANLMRNALAEETAGQPGIADMFEQQLGAAQAAADQAGARTDATLGRMKATAEAGLDENAPMPEAPPAAAPSAAPPIQDSVAQMEAILRDIAANPAKPGTVASRMQANQAEAILADLDRIGKIQGLGLRKLEEAPALPGEAAPLLDEAAIEAQDEAIERATKDQSFQKVLNPRQPRLTDNFQVAVKLNDNERRFLQELINTGDVKVSLSGPSPRVGAKTLAEAATVLEVAIKEGDYEGRELKMAATIAKRVRTAMQGMGDDIDAQAELDDMIEAALNDVKGELNCNFTNF